MNSLLPLLLRPVRLICSAPGGQRRTKGGETGKNTRGRLKEEREREMKREV